MCDKSLINILAKASYCTFNTMYLFFFTYLPYLDFSTYIPTYVVNFHVARLIPSMYDYIKVCSCCIGLPCLPASGRPVWSTSRVLPPSCRDGISRPFLPTEFWFLEFNAVDVNCSSYNSSPFTAEYVLVKN